MNELTARKISCPYCGEAIEILIDCSESEQRYVEDCSVCCRPIEFAVVIEHDGELLVSVSHEND